MTKIRLFTAGWLLMVFGSCVTLKHAAPLHTTLSQAFAGDFMIGAAVNTAQFEEKDTAAAALLKQQFNAVTPENCMKAGIIQPGWSNYNFGEADSLVAFAAANKLAVNAHCLIWHSQLPGFMRRMQDADSVRQYFINHINTVAGRYDGKVYSWDVVNEALNEDGSLRNTIFRQKLGNGYVTEAFRLAQTAAPHTKLYYNDYNIEQPQKREGAIALVRNIQKAGVRIDGIGIQGHWNIRHLPLQEIEASIKAFSSLGVKVMFTELDISVLPDPPHLAGADVNQQALYSKQSNPFANGLPDSMQVKLANAYASLFRLFLKYKSSVGRITFWGVNDRQSWLNNWPVHGRTNYPLPFDRQNKPKAAFYAILKTKQKP
ncbi:MAG TPA: endo-1,4-beta-xylanase [Chitinophagaceae bacterium]|nr:endo-1,4-beta-xylanase [Chitinophagaceae bacterium]